MMAENMDDRLESLTEEVSAFAEAAACRFDRVDSVGSVSIISERYIL